MSRYFDERAELYDFRTRMYLPKLGRFIQRDFLHSANEYLFVNNDPLTFVDPLGTEKESASTGDLEGLDLSLFTLLRQADRVFTSPQNVKGELLSGPLRLWTAGLPNYKRGYVYDQTKWAAWADTLPGYERNNVALASRKMTAEAVQSETAVTSFFAEHGT